MKDTINNEVVDTVFDHETHLVSRDDCSECFKNPPVVEYDKEEGIVLAHEKEEEDNELPMFGIDLERLYESGRVLEVR